MSNAKARALPLATAILLLIIAAPAFAHVGSPDVFYEGNAGPYHLYVSVMVPPVIPGVAEVQVRSENGDVQQVGTAVTRLSGAGSQYAPTPDAAHKSEVDPKLFSSNVWLMQYGSLRVLLKVSGEKGNGEMSVPVASFARRNLTMPLWLGAILLALGIGLAAGAVSIIAAAARDSTLVPGATVEARARRRGRIAGIAGTIVVAVVFGLALLWWSSDAREFTAITNFFKPPPLALALDGNRLKIRAAESEWARYNVMGQLIPDHNHLMHLFLLRTPGFDRFWHLHPERDSDGGFVANLPSLDPGHYKVLADVVDKSGFPWTLVGEIDLPSISGTALSGDDSGGSFDPLVGADTAPSDVLSDGTRVEFEHEPLHANIPLLLRFSIQDSSGTSARDLQPYMGMAAHVEIIRSDLSVFAHIHPSGSAPMAAVMLASNDSTSGGAAAMNAAMTMPNGSTMTMPEKIGPEFSMPYGFPQPGLYRVFVQFKRGNKIETAAFDTQVN